MDGSYSAQAIQGSLLTWGRGESWTPPLHLAYSATAVPSYLLALLQLKQHPLQLLLGTSRLSRCCCSLRLQCRQLPGGLIMLALLQGLLLLHRLQLAACINQRSLQLPGSTQWVTGTVIIKSVG